MDACTLTWDQLYKLLSEALELFRKYRDQYGYDEEQAKQHAVFATLEGLRLEFPVHGFALD